jgi:hypothetical protein
MSSFPSVLSQEDLEYILDLPEVHTAWENLNETTSNNVRFTIELTESIRVALETRFSLDFSGVSRIPMRWIKGDTVPHIDSGASEFENTYLVYLNDCPGEFLIGDESYPITQNTGYMFNEGTSHSTANTGFVTRLLLGPMNEFAEPVGISARLKYYANQSDALGDQNILGYSETSYTVGDISSGTSGGFTYWRIASNSTGTSPQNVVYAVGDTLAGTGAEVYYLYPNAPCFLEGSMILCEVDGASTYVPVEHLKKGTLVKTSLHGFKPVALIGKAQKKNPGTNERIEDRLYKLSPSKYPALVKELYLTGCHSVLEYPLTEAQKEAVTKHLGKLYVTDKKYRLTAFADERAEPWNSEGTYTVYHFALENDDEKMNYGVFANVVLLVEKCSLRTLRGRGNMEFV